MRLFIAIDLPKEVKDYLFELQKEFFGLAKINWVAKKNIHLTLKFLGEVKEEDLIEIKTILNKIKFKKFKVGLQNSGVFPRRDFIRILWVGLKPIEKIMELQKQVDESLLLKFPSDQRFQTHLTLGRVKLIKDKKKFLGKLDSIKIKELTFEVGSFKLIKSELNKDGPKYTVLEKYDLV